MCGFGVELRPGGRPDADALEHGRRGLQCINLDGSTLWQLALLELWLERHVGQRPAIVTP